VFRLDLKLSDCLTKLSRTVRNRRRRAYCKSGTQTAPYVIRLDLKDCCTCVPPRPEISLKIWLLDCCTARITMRVKISYAVVYSKPQNSIWIKSYAVSTDGPFLSDCLTELSRTVRNRRRRAYCKSGTQTAPFQNVRNDLVRYNIGSKTYVMISYGTKSGQ
jgi:hypothetical protein